MTEDARKAKVKFLKSFFKSFQKQWDRIQKLHILYPEEGLVLAYCLTDALAYYRYGFNSSGLRSTEQFVKILYDYQTNDHFFKIPPLTIRNLPMEKSVREIGKDIKNEVLTWLQNNHSNQIGSRVDLLWNNLPSTILDKLSATERRKGGHLYQISWAGFYYHHIRTAGIHYAHFPIWVDKKEWNEIQSAIKDILRNLESECLDKACWPHELPSPKSIFEPYTYI